LNIEACNNRGYSLIEVLIATFLTAFGIIAVLSMQPMSWKTAAKSDYISRTAEILQKELESKEMYIMNANNSITTGTTTRTIYASGESTLQSGDMAFTVQTVTKNNGDGSWTVSITVTGPRSNTVSESLVVTRQEPFKF
jgi:Tfp pilus assembly protein PilV